MAASESKMKRLAITKNKIIANHLNFVEIIMEHYIRERRTILFVHAV